MTDLFEFGLTEGLPRESSDARRVGMRDDADAEVGVDDADFVFGERFVPFSCGGILPITGDIAAGVLKEEEIESAVTTG